MNRSIAAALLLLPLALFACGKDDLKVAPTAVTAQPEPSAPTAAEPAGKPTEEPAEEPTEEPVPVTKKIIQNATNEMLFDVWAREKRTLGADGIADLNERTLRALEESTPVPGAHPFSIEDGIAAIREIDLNLVTSDRTKYEQPGTAIGYCFGRAMFAHLSALKKKYHRNQIKKIWAVGTMKTSAYTWAFHVATAIQDGSTGEWRMVDSFLSTPTSPRNWFRLFQAQNSEDRDLRIYVTPGEKFTPNLGKYSRAQLGLDLSREQDWYRHYFTDLMGTLKIRKKLDQVAAALFASAT